MALGNPLHDLFFSHAGCAVCQPHHILCRKIHGSRISCISHEKSGSTTAGSMVCRRIPERILLPRVLDVRVPWNRYRCALKHCIQSRTPDNFWYGCSLDVCHRDTRSRSVPMAPAARIIHSEPLIFFPDYPGESMEFCFLG